MESQPSQAVSQERFSTSFAMMSKMDPLVKERIHNIPPLCSLFFSFSFISFSFRLSFIFHFSWFKDALLKEIIQEEAESMAGSVLPAWVEQEDSFSGSNNKLSSSTSALNKSEDKSQRFTVSPSVDVNGLPKISFPFILFSFSFSFYLRFIIFVLIMK